MRWEQQVQYASISDIGFRRRNNQDSYTTQLSSDQETWLSRGHLFVVADGMGGHAVGELASKIAVDTLPLSYFKTKDCDIPEALKQATEAANASIHERGTANRDFLRMGTTCTSLVLSPQGCVIGHVGDSRCYRIRGSRIDQLSFDHSLQWELLRRGQLKPEDIYLHEPRHVITRSLGPEESVQVDIEGPYPVQSGDIFLLCSDGLTGHLDDSEIGTIARELPPNEACKLLVNLANLRGGSDNITVLIIRVGEIPQGVSAVPEELSLPQEEGHSWAWLLGFWATSITFAAGVCIALLGHKAFGISLAVFAFLAFLFVLSKKWPKSTPVRNNKSDASETVIWRPYRSASAKISRKLLNNLASAESELQGTASDEGWDLNWKEHEKNYKAATKAIAQKKFSEALKAYAKLIDILMAGIHLQRKQMRQEEKWGKSSQ